MIIPKKKKCKRAKEFSEEALQTENQQLFLVIKQFKSWSGQTES